MKLFLAPIIREFQGQRDSCKSLNLLKLVFSFVKYGVSCLKSSFGGRLCIHYNFKEPKRWNSRLPEAPQDAETRSGSSVRTASHSQQPLQPRIFPELLVKVTEAGKGEGTRSDRATELSRVSCRPSSLHI